MSDSVESSERELRKRAQAFLPDDVVINILSWLPAKDVLRCRSVCKLLRDLTSSKDFTDLHFRRSFPLILKDDFTGQSLLDRFWEPAQTRIKRHKLYGPDHGYMLFSHNGLIVVDTRNLASSFIIYNPIYRDVVKLTILTRRYEYDYRGRMCGVFLHPVQKEYCILWQKTLSVQPCKVQYRILNLESDPKWRDIATQNVRIWDWEIKPVLIDKYLYWIVEPSQRFDDYPFNCEIMEYDIINENFQVIPCPVRVNYENVRLVNIDGVVSVVQVLHSKETSVEINIWTLNDHVEQSWTRSNYISSSDVYSGYKMSKAISFRNGELVLESDKGRYKRLYAFNLKLGTFRKFGQKYECWEFLPHVTSLVSLKNCKSDICMSDEDENNQP